MRIANFSSGKYIVLSHLFHPNNSMYSSRTEVISYCELRSTITDMSADGLVKSLIWKILANLVKHNGVCTCIYNLTLLHTILQTYLSFCLSLCLSVHLSIGPSVYLSIYLPACYSCVCQSAWLCPLFFHPVFKSQKPSNVHEVILW